MAHCDSNLGLTHVLERLEELKFDIDGIAKAQRRVESVVHDIFVKIQQLPEQQVQPPCSKPQTSEREAAGENSICEDTFMLATKSSNEGSPGGRARTKTSSYRSEGSEDNLRHAYPGRPRERRGPVLKQHEALRATTSQFSSNHLSFMGATLTRTLSSSDPRRCRPLHPDSSRRIIFDLMMFVVLIYDSVVIPYQLAWPMPLEGWVKATSWYTFLFWLSDLLLGFLTAYRHNGKLVMDFRKIARQYVSTYFIPNLILVLTDFAGIVVEMTKEEGTAGETALIVKSARIIKLNRMLRLVAMFRTGQIAQLYDRVLAAMRRRGMAEQMDIMIRAFKLVFLIIWVNHLGGCVWHLIGRNSREQWLAENRPAGAGSLEYLLAFYWSTSAMIAGESVMVPTNAYELLGTICFVLFGFIFSSVLISSLATTLINFQMANKEQRDKLNTLRQFLYQHQVDSTLCVPIEKQVLARMSNVKRLCQKDVSALSMLSPLMRTELLHAIYGPSISSLLFNAICTEVDGAFVKDICFHCLAHEAYEPGHRLFRPTEEAVGARYVYWGSLEYLQATGPVSGSASFSEQAITVKPEVAQKGQWLSQLALWARWKHRGWMDTTTQCEMLTMPANAFIEVLASRPELAMMAQDYSAALVALCSKMPDEHLSDIRVAVEHEAVIMNMHALPRKLMSLASLSCLESHHSTRSNRHISDTLAVELRREVEEDECDVVMCPGDRVCRLLGIVAVRLSRQDTSVLVQLGTWDGEVITPEASLPQVQARIGEPPREALARLVASKLPFLAKADAEKCIEQEMSLEEKVASSGLCTKYAWMMFDARAETEFQPPLSYLERRHVAPDEQRASDLDREAFAVASVNDRRQCFIYSWVRPSEVEKLTAGHAGEAMAERLLFGLLLDDQKVNIVQTSQLSV